MSLKTDHAEAVQPQTQRDPQAVSTLREVVNSFDLPETAKQAVLDKMLSGIPARQIG